jgi:hypothetical protein
MDHAAAVREAERRYRERVAELETQLEHARRERDAAIRAAVNAGLSTREVARAAGLSFQRVSQIARP